MNYHVPVLINKILNFVPLDIDKEENLIIDACFGEGGYTDIFLEKFKNLFIVGIEQDTQIYNIVKEKYKDEKRLILFNSNFINIDQILKVDYLKDKKPRFIVFDLGISMFHIKESDKGISFNKDSRLDMRINKDAKESAYDIINNYSKEELADLFYYLADETMSRQIANEIVNYRKKKKIETNEELVKIVANVKKGSRKNPATKVFQALRIKVNNELENLKIVLEKLINIVDKDCVISIVSYHSGEDRIVKNFIKNNISFINPLVKKPILPDYEEIKANPSARSAKLRVFSKK
ncbi:MAG TPA: 16S rRNA (cytosine(1402)-N(4))-methyltransferase RsmH [Exilispira sp.]|nr:16S rRNA (cytosine(1402)-N(4))-methyltransferase RsmH [Exilispira sp.]